MPYSVWPHRWQLPGSPVPGILQARTLEWVAISFSNAWKWKVKVKSESEVTQSCLTCSDPIDCSPPGSSIHGIFQARVLEWGAIAFSDEPRQCIKKQTHHFADKGLCSQSYSFSNSHVRMWELDHKEGWALKNGWFWTVVLKKTRVGPFYCKVIKPVDLKGNQPLMFIGRAESETPFLCPPDAKSQLVWKDPDAGKDWRQEKKGTTEEEMFVWCH